MANGNWQMCLGAALGVVHGTWLFVGSASAQVELRGGEAAPAGAVVAVSDAGVALGAAGAAAGSSASVVIGWDRVKSVDGVWAEKSLPFAAAAEQAWRARTRLERGDAVAAEPLFEKLFETTKSQHGPTAEVVAEGLLRCRVRRGSHVGAIEPWLAAVSAGSDLGTAVLHPSWASDAGLSAVLDTSGLAPSIPPMWLAWPSVEGYARSTPWLGAAGGSKAATARVALLATLYHQSAQFEAGLPVNWTDVPTSDAAVQLVAQIVEARVGDAEHRADARKALLDRLKTAGHPRSEDGTPAALAPWMEAWLHAALGRSLVREEGTEQKQAGVLELLQLPARYATAHPYLAGLALAESAVTLQGMGDAEGASILARELTERYPTHPVNEWQPFRAIRPSRPPSPNDAPGASGGTDAKPPAGTLQK
jgi:hypothetical protein